MPPPRRAGQPVVVRPQTRPRGVANQPSRTRNPQWPSDAVGTASMTKPTLETARRIAESVIVAAISSAGLYLVGSVYTDAYYGRLAIEVTSLDLAPPYVALQSVHALWGLLEYPLILLLFYVMYRTFSRSHRLRAWLAQVRRRFPRLLPILA